MEKNNQTCNPPDSHNYQYKTFIKPVGALEQIGSFGIFPRACNSCEVKMERKEEFSIRSCKKCDVPEKKFLIKKFFECPKCGDQDLVYIYEAEKYFIPKSAKVVRL